MMRFTKQGDVTQLVHITGPTHNFLSLQLKVNPSSSDVKVEEFEIPGPKYLLAEDVKREVCASVEDANRILGTNFYIIRMQFVSSDNGPTRLYRELARQIVNYHVNHLQSQLPKKLAALSAFI